MAYDLDIFTGCTGLFTCLADWVNQVTNGAFWVIILIGFGVTVFLATFNFRANRAFSYAGWSVSMLALLLITIGLIDWTIGVWFIVVGIIGIVVTRMMEK